MGSALPVQAMPTVHFVLSAEEAPYLALVDEARSALHDVAQVTSGPVDSKPGGAIALVTVGVEAALRWVGGDEARLVIATLIPASSWQAMAGTIGGHPRTAILLDQPFSRQMDLVRVVLPAARDLGVVLGSVSSEEESRITAAARMESLGVHAAIPERPDDLAGAITHVLRRSDALLAVPDPTIYNRFTVRGTLLTSFRMRRPVIAFSESWVRAGALAAVYSTPSQSGAEVADILRAWLEDAGNLPAPRKAQRFSVSVNRQVAFSLGINLPSDEVLMQRMLDKELQE